MNINLMYQATITNKSINKGKLSVQVVFENNVTGDNFSETFETNQWQDSDWIGEQIKRKLSHMNSLPALNESITIGAFNLIMPAKTNKEIYQENATRYLKFMNAARHGFIESDAEDIINLRQWLRDNFNVNFIDIF